MEQHLELCLCLPDEYKYHIHSLLAFFGLHQLLRKASGTLAASPCLPASCELIRFAIRCRADSVLKVSFFAEDRILQETGFKSMMRLKYLYKNLLNSLNKSVNT